MAGSEPKLPRPIVDGANGSGMPLPNDEPLETRSSEGELRRMAFERTRRQDLADTELPRLAVDDLAASLARLDQAALNHIALQASGYVGAFTGAVLGLMPAALLKGPILGPDGETPLPGQKDAKGHPFPGSDPIPPRRRRGWPPDRSTLLNGSPGDGSEWDPSYDELVSRIIEAQGQKATGGDISIDMTPYGLPGVTWKWRWHQDKEGFKHVVPDPENEGRGSTTVPIPHRPGEHMGKSYVLIGESSCVDQAWVQYVRLTIDCLDKNSDSLASFEGDWLPDDKGSPFGLSNEDPNITYPYQKGFGLRNGSAQVMVDHPGPMGDPTLDLFEGVSRFVKGALAPIRDRLAAEPGVAAAGKRRRVEAVLSSLSQCQLVVLKYEFMSYLLCVDPWDCLAKYHITFSLTYGRGGTGVIKGPFGFKLLPCK